MFELKKASQDLNSNELIFTSEWIFDLPGQSLSINNEMLHLNYNIPTGPDGYGIEDLNYLEKIGFIEKISESEQDKVTLEKKIRYRIKELRQME